MNNIFLTENKKLSINDWDLRLVNLPSTAFKSDRNSSKSSGAFIFCKCPIFRDWFFAFKLSHSFSLISLASLTSGSVQRSKSNSVRLLVVRSNSLADFLRLSSSLCFFWSLVFALKLYQRDIYWHLLKKNFVLGRSPRYIVTIE